MRALTGIKPTGIPHIGNYVGALRPTLELVGDKGCDVNLFIADYHALNLVSDRAHIRERSYSIAATLLALGLDPEQCLFYRQSDVPETFELTVFLTSFTPKGLMNRAHAYKAAIQQNREDGKSEDDQDVGVSMGLYIYPILMAADILLFDADIVPVGRDQRQHIEFARDIAGSVNAVYGEGTLKLPEGRYGKDAEELPGLDGRKMSKSYGNVIPIFAPDKEILAACKKVKTDSRRPEEPKDPDDSILYKLFKIIATPEEFQSFHDRFVPGGMGYGTAKTELADLLIAKFTGPRAEYERLMADKGHLDALLLKGADKARTIATATLDRIRKAGGFHV